MCVHVCVRSLLALVSFWPIHLMSSYFEQFGRRKRADRGSLDEDDGPQDEDDAGAKQAKRKRGLVERCKGKGDTFWSSQMHRAKLSKRVADAHLSQKKQARAIGELHTHRLRKGISGRVDKKTGEIYIVTRGRQARFEPSTILDLGYSRPMSSANLAATYACCRSSVRRLKALTAATYMNRQAQLMEQLKAHFERGAAWKYSVENLRWDETQGRFVMQVSEDIPASEQSWHLQVIRQGWAVGSMVTINENDLREEAIELNIVRPIVPLAGAKAGDLEDGLQTVPSARPFVQFSAALDKAADMSVKIFEMDGATSNSKWVAFRQSQLAVNDELPKNVVTITSSCSLHDNSRIENSVVAAVSLNVILNAYSGSKFLGSESHFSQLQSSLFPRSHGNSGVFNKDTVECLDTPAPPTDPFIQELMDYSIAHFGRFKSLGPGLDDEAPPGSRQRRWQRRVATFGPR